ncbi:MAG: sensor histidine kinase [Sulfurospirillaceae bacterium]|nr:sensor histidine kinase [Sulfurospirillaceae bacterium]
MQIFNKKYLTSFLFVVCLVFLTAVYIILVFINYDANKTMMQELAKTNQLNIVKGYKRQIDEWLSVKKRVISSAAQFLSPLSPQKDFNEIRRILQGALAAGSFKSVYMGYDDDFYIPSVSLIRPESFFPTQRPWYIAGKEQQGVFITLPYVDYELEEEVISIVSPVYKNGDFIGVLASDLFLDFIQKEILSINLPFNGFAFLVSKKGKILVSPYGFIKQKCHGCEPAIGVILDNPQEDGAIVYEHAGTKYLVSYAPLENSDWIFATVLNEESIFKDIDEKLFQNVIMAIGFSVFGFFGIFLFLFLSRKLFQHKRLLDSFAHSSIHAMAIVDNKKRIVLANEPLQKFLELENPIEFGEELSNLSHSNGNTSLIKKIIEDINDVMDNHLMSKTLKIISDKSSECMLIQVMAIIEKGIRMEGCVLTISDVTHECNLEMQNKEHEQMVLQHSKMAAIGEMIGAITHQWRQPLNTMLLIVSDLEDMISSTQQPLDVSHALSHLSRSRSSIKLMNETIQVFRNFYKEDFTEREFNLIDIVEDVLCICTPQIQLNGIETQFNYDSRKSFYLVGYPTYLKQVLLNLISNAKDELSKMKSKDYMFHAYITINIWGNNTAYMISVEDNGLGINPNMAEKIFEQFYTTKGEEGTGTGLYISKLLFEKKMKGSIRLDNFCNPTRFLITLEREVV